MMGSTAARAPAPEKGEQDEAQRWAELFGLSHLQITDYVHWQVHKPMDAVTLLDFPLEWVQNAAVPQGDDFVDLLWRSVQVLRAREAAEPSRHDP